MVYPGHVSQGCMTCKLRKIRCDLARPACRHCTKSRRVCLRYGERLEATGRPTIGPGGVGQRGASSYATNTLVGDDSRHIEASAAAISLLENLFSFDTTQVGSDTSNTGTSHVAVSALNTIRKCIYFLRQPEQSRSDRAALLAEYGRTTSELRAALTGLSSSSPPHTLGLACAAFLFSIYEMIVNIDPEDKTWRIHLDGLLKIFSGQSTYLRALPTDDFDTLHHAIHHCNSEEDIFSRLAVYEVSSHVKTSLILDAAILRLRRLAAEAESLLHEASGTRRKLDVQKLRASIKNVQKNLKLIPRICSKAELHVSRVSPDMKLTNALFLVRWNDYHCLQLIIADLLSSTGRLIHPSNENYEHTSKYTAHSSIIREAAESICSALPTILSATSVLNQSQATRQPLPLSQTTSTPIMSLLVLWPLCSALKALSMTDSRQSGIRATLWDIGLNACIPRASAMSNSKAEDTKWSDVIDGLLLVRVALSQQMRRAFHQFGVISVVS